MPKLGRYARLLGLQLRAALLLAMQYRVDFLVDGLISAFWTVTTLVPLLVAFHDRPGIGGWSFGEALLVLGWFTLLEGIMEGAISPSLARVVDAIRKGTLDFVLLKPADAQFLVSTASFHPWHALSGLLGVAMFVVGFREIGRLPSLAGVLGALVLFATAVLLLYSLWILVASAAFYVVKVDNLTQLFTSVFDAARWPSTMFRGAVRFVLTWIVPLALMTSYPAEALLGRLPAARFAAAIGGAALFALVARRVWLRSIGRYTSASS